ncbi:MAG TPA: helix-turn-helix domain-containing protein [Abditibacteriaceae bacterium]|jgi:transposase
MAKPSQNPNEVESDFGQLRMLLTDGVQERYEVVRPLLLQQSVTATQRSRQTGTHARTIRRYVRRFEREGMRGLFDERALLVRGHSVPDVIRFEVIRLKTLYPPLHMREIANIVFARLGCKIDHKTVRQILRDCGILDQQRLPFIATRFHDHNDSRTARLEVIKLYYQGWNIKSIAGFLGLSRQHIYTLLERFEQEQFAASLPRSRKPHHPHRKVYLPVLKRIAELQREYPYIGRFRMWSLLKREGITELGESTVGAAMALNRLAYSELTPEAKPPKVHPFKSRTWHQYWFIDHRYLTKIDGVQYYSLCILEGYSRAFLAGAVLATQARGPVLKLLHEAVAQWGAPMNLVSDSGGAFVSHDYARVCERLGIVVQHIEARQSWQNMIETHFNIQRKMADFQFARCCNEAELQQEHSQFIELYNTSEHLAHQKRKASMRTPQAVLSWVRGQLIEPQSMNRAFRELRWQRVADRAGYVLVQNYYLYAERAASRQRVCLWLWDDTLKIDCRDEVLASYPCVYDEAAGHIEKVGEPVLHENSLSRQQPRLLEIGSDQWQRLRRIQKARRQRRARTSKSQLLLAEMEIASKQRVG